MCATTSPPTPALRASWPVMTPRDVETMEVPMPPSTFWMSPAPAYVRRPGRETRLRPEIAERRSRVYIRRTRRSCAGRRAAGVTRLYSRVLYFAGRAWRTRWDVLAMLAVSTFGLGLCFRLLGGSLVGLRVLLLELLARRLLALGLRAQHLVARLLRGGGTAGVRLG